MEKQKSEKEKLNVVIKKITKRSNGTIRIQQDFSNCPTMAEQHTAHLSDINYLIEKYKPDELQAYINARTQHRQEIVGHDFSAEPSLQEANNIVYRSKQEFESLSDDVKSHFKNHLEFLKFIDNPANAEKMLKLGILTKRQVETITMETDTAQPTQTTINDEQEASDPSSKKSKSKS